MDTFCFHIGAFVAPDCKGIHLVPISTCSPQYQSWTYGANSWIRYKLNPWYDSPNCMDTFSSNNKDDNMDNSCLYHGLKYYDGI